MHRYLARTDLLLIRHCLFIFGGPCDRPSDTACSPEHRGVQSWLDLHRHQLLQEELAGVRDLHLADVFSRVLATTAMVLKLEQVRFTEESTSVADVHSVAI